MARICVFGHSIVSDEYALGFDSWVTLLRKSLTEEDVVFNLGIAGETTKGLLKRIETEIIAREPDTILVLIGGNDARINNVIEDSIETSEKEFKENIRKLIIICKKFTRNVVFIGETPADESKTTPTIWSDTEHFTNKNLKIYEDFKKEVCKKEKVLFLPMLDTWLKLDYKKLLYEEDGLHPNKKGHEKIFQAVKEFLIKNKVLQ
jgi:lysophospholipase L1-like esterase